MTKAPKTTIESTPEVEEARSTHAQDTIREAPRPATPEPPVQSPQTASEQPKAGFVAQVQRLVQGHEHAVLGGIAGLVIALLMFLVGFWQTLFICLLVFVGIALGQYLDGDPKIINWIRRLLAREHDEG